MARWRHGSPVALQQSGLVRPGQAQDSRGKPADGQTSDSPGARTRRDGTQDGWDIRRMAGRRH